MKWSTALFGHYKSKTVGWEKRAEPGDVIDFKPDKCWNCNEQEHKEIIRLLRNRNYLENNIDEIKELFLQTCRVKNWRSSERFHRIWNTRFMKFGLSDARFLPQEIKTYFSCLPGASLWHLRGRDVWGETEIRAFLIIDLDGPSTEQLPGMVEPYWDLNSYIPYVPIPEIEFSKARVEKIYEKKGFEALKKFDLGKEYANYIKEAKARSLFPTDFLKKRRMTVPLETLESLGVDMDKMLNPSLPYIPNVELNLPHCWDKMKTRTLSLSDKLRTIEPIEI